MQDFFRLDELTWPEVAALPRETPIVLPLGGGYDLSRLPALLQTDVEIGLLPAIPFGWVGGGVEVPVQVFSNVVHSLVGNLLEDGFTSIHVLSPVGLDLGADIHLILLPSQTLASLPFPGDREKVVLLPVGQTEQHGYHAPLSTDTLIIEAIAKGTVGCAPDQAFTLPVFPYGVSTHRRSFPGTFNIGGRVFEDFWLAIVDKLVGSGFTRFYLMSGHGGNSSFLVNVVKYAGEKYPEIFCATAFLYLSGAQGVAALEARRQSGLGGWGTPASWKLR